MGRFVVGQVVVVAFPFSNLSGQKRRPALVLAEVEFGDLILCQITSRSYSSKSAVEIDSGAFDRGGLPVASFARPDKLFTAEATIIEKAVGELSDSAMNVMLTRVRELFPAKRVL